MNRDKRIKSEITKLKKFTKDIDPNKKNTVESLIQNIAFMTIALQDLIEIIKVKGYTETYTNGQHQQGVKKSSEVEIYNTMIKNHMAALRQLSDMIPDTKAAKNELDDFLKAVK